MERLSIDMSNIGIYQVVCITNNKFYLGSSKNLSRRWKEHKLELRKNKHHSPILQNAWNKYGAESFIFNVIESILVDDRDYIHEREQWYLDTLTPYDDTIGYNISPRAHGGFRGTKNTRKVNQYTFTGEFIKQWESGSLIQRELKVYGIFDCLYRKQKSSHGFVWCFDDEVPIFYDKYHDDIIRRKVDQYDKQGNFIKRWDSVTEASHATGTGISEAISGNNGRKTANGFIWKYAV